MQYGSADAAQVQDRPHLLKYRGADDRGNPVFQQKRVDLQIGLDIVNATWCSTGTLRARCERAGETLAAGLHVSRQILTRHLDQDTGHGVNLLIDAQVRVPIADENRTTIPLLGSVIAHPLPLQKAEKDSADEKT